MNNWRVIDFFCGAGGFSEGFKQLGFNIIKGYDFWVPAIDTYNYNFDLCCEPKNILDFQESIEEINNIPDSEVIIGSPPCVSFSSSNKSGKADKSLGVTLTEVYLRIIAVKKHRPNSILKAWFMENVVNSRRYLQSSYTFKDLALELWAMQHNIDPNQIAIDLSENSVEINSAYYGAIQQRKRIISGEILKEKKLIIPRRTKSRDNFNTIRKLTEHLPTPFSKKGNMKIRDIQYTIEIKQSELTDHFYDTGVYQSEWESSKYLKTNHPYMGKMSFPENKDNPSRTITATKIANSRESILYKSEIERKGNGEYRLPTVREAATIMGFPITYQFIGGSEGTKWRLVGNAVCCCVSRAFAQTIIDAYQLKEEKNLILNMTPDLELVHNLNTYSLSTYDSPPIKKEGSKFRRHPFKDGNLTVTLSNFNIIDSACKKRRWESSIQYGTGAGFPSQPIEDGFYKKLEPLIKELPTGITFLKQIKKELPELVAPARILQEMYEQQSSKGTYSLPEKLIERVKDIISINQDFTQKDIVIFKHKSVIPAKQLFALYAINMISSITNTDKIS